MEGTAGTTIGISSDITLVAQWQPDPEYTINVVPYLKNNATRSMTITNVEFEFIDVASGEDKREEFIELSKRYVVDTTLTITPPSGTTFVCKGYESYSFR